MSDRAIALRNDRKEVARLGLLAEQFGADNGLSTDDVLAINLVLDEIVINVIAHGYDDDAEHLIHVRLGRKDQTVTVEVEDDGRPFNPLDLPTPNFDLPLEERPIGGLGVHIVRSMMDTVDYRRDGDRNVLTMTRTLDLARQD